MSAEKTSRDSSKTPESKSGRKVREESRPDYFWLNGRKLSCLVVRW